MEIIKLQTTDGVIIIGDFIQTNGAKKAVLLLHMMPETRGSWIPLSTELNKAGLATLAIDLRGHGESVQKSGIGNQESEKIDYKKFSDAEHQASRLDVDAAMNFLKSKGFAEENISVAGASIGANLALDAMHRYGKIPQGVLLSPGLDYRGVLTESAMKQLSANQGEWRSQRGWPGPQKVWIIAAQGDEYSAQSTLTLAKLQPNISKTTIFSGSDHGTNLFKSQDTLIQDIVKFFR